jgi:hypothetical protein
LALDLRRLANLRMILKKRHICKQNMIDGFIGFESRERPAIIVIDTPLGSSMVRDSVAWLASVYAKRKRTPVLALNSSILDEFVVCLSQQLRIPQFEILRLDLPREFCINIVLKSRMKIIADLEKINPAIASSCIVAMNYLKLHHQDRTDLIEMLEKLRPLEYLDDDEKRMNYMKNCQSEIVCQLLKGSIDLENLNFENVIILDSNVFDDADLLHLLNAVNPSCLRLYGSGSAAVRLSGMNDATIIHERTHFFNDKPVELARLLAFLTLMGIPNAWPLVSFLLSMAGQFRIQKLQSMLQWRVVLYYECWVIFRYI